MIIVEIVGGLANQMVIYAAARALAEKNADTLALDLNTLRKDRIRKFELHKLSMDLRIATEEEIARVRRKLSNPAADRLKEKIFRKLGIRRPYIYEEPYSGYDANFFRLSGDVYIKGNFASRRYFESIEPLLHREFRFRGEMSPRTREYERTLREGTSVGIHVRRGDYATNPHTRKFHGLIGVEYYSEAMKVLEERVGDPVYHVFSDDLDWARENLKSRAPMRFVDHTDAETSHEDMYLMSRCSHYILGNSGFGFWGAWMNTGEGKIVIAPKRWCADDSFNRVFDLPPPDWIRI